MPMVDVASTTHNDSEVPFADCWIAPAARHAALRVMSSGWVTTGPEVAAFETEFAAVVGAPHAVATSSCTAAIELALRSLRLRPGARVLTSTMTFAGAVQAILHAGLRPVLVDVDPRTGMPTPETTAEAAGRCGRPSAMVVTHLTGDVVSVPQLAAAAGLPRRRVVEDAAHALGAEVEGRRIGSGAAVCFSFYATKNLPIGEGGMVTTDDPERADWLARARLHGMSRDAWRRYLPGGGWQYDVDVPGMKANMADLEAAIGRVQLRHFNEWRYRRTQIAAYYDGALHDLRAVRRPHRPPKGAGRHAWHLYAVQLDPRRSRGRDEVAALLAERGIGTSVHFIPVHQLTYFRRALGVTGTPFPGADRWFEQELSLPLYPRLGNEQVERVCEAVREVTRRRGVR